MQRNAILLPIYPEHAETILNGTKRFEFRKVRCRTDTAKIILYATDPVKRVVGEVEILDVIIDTPQRVWELTSDGAGISQQAFDRYFLGHEKAVAYRLGATHRYDVPLKPIELGINFIPQAAVYL